MSGAVSRRIPASFLGHYAARFPSPPQGEVSAQCLFYRWMFFSNDAGVYGGHGQASAAAAVTAVSVTAVAFGMVHAAAVAVTIAVVIMMTEPGAGQAGLFHIAEEVVVDFAYLRTEFGDVGSELTQFRRIDVGVSGKCVQFQAFCRKGVAQRPDGGSMFFMEFVHLHPLFVGQTGHDGTVVRTLIVAAVATVKIGSCHGGYRNAGDK